MRIASFNDQGSHLQHKHDATGPIPCFNIFNTCSRHPQFTAAVIDHSINPSDSLIMSNQIAERSDGELRLARAPRATRLTYLLLHYAAFREPAVS